LAVVVNAECRSNVGNIVRIVAADSGASFIRFRGQGHVWIVVSHRPMTWYMYGMRHRRKTGPVPDNRLQPIRGLRTGPLVSKPVQTDMDLEEYSGESIC